MQIFIIVSGVVVIVGPLIILIGIIFHIILLVIDNVEIIITTINSFDWYTVHICTNTRLRSKIMKKYQQTMYEIYQSSHFFRFYPFLNKCFSTIKILSAIFSVVWYVAQTYMRVVQCSILLISLNFVTFELLVFEKLMVTISFYQRIFKLQFILNEQFCAIWHYLCVLKRADYENWRLRQTMVFTQCICIHKRMNE